MSTEIKGFLTGQPRVSISPDIAGALYIKHQNGEGGWTGWAVSRADFLAAAAKECDVIVIERADLPEVPARPGQMVVEIEGSTYASIFGRDEAHREALRWLAVAEYLDAHPPVSAEVAALASLIEGAEIVNTDEAVRFARHLISQGVRIEVKP